MNKNRQRRHQFYYERLKVEIKFKEAVKVLPMLEIKPNKRVRRICN